MNISMLAPWLRARVIKASSEQEAIKILEGLGAVDAHGCIDGVQAVILTGYPHVSILGKQEGDTVVFS